MGKTKRRAMSRKREIKIMLLLGIASCGMIGAFTEFRSPLSLYRGPTYWPQPAQDDGKWVIESWDAIYHRSADEAYVPRNLCACPSDVCSAECCNRTSATLWNCTASPCGCCCKNGSSTRHTEQLSALLFGKSLFRVEEAFANGMLDVPQMQAAGIPAISFSRLAPAIQYSEHGFIAGLNAHRKLGVDRNWRIGARASLPFKMIDTSRDCCGCAIAETFEDVMALGIQNECSPTTGGRAIPIPTFAYRLDFLSSLLIPSVGSCGGVADSLVTYGDGANIYFPGTTTLNCGQLNGPTKIAQTDVGPYYAKQVTEGGPVFYPPTAGNESVSAGDTTPPPPPVFATASF
ncbi:MAG: hypothetical protein U1E13_01085, partial [Methylophilaceae bacterium]|nr:hypothetical protein [Methylophilaceae bacterium]